MSTALITHDDDGSWLLGIAVFLVLDPLSRPPPRLVDTLANYLLQAGVYEPTRAA